MLTESINFEASYPPKPQDLDVQIWSGADPDIDQASDSSGLNSGIAFIQAPAPTIITSIVFVESSFAYSATTTAVIITTTASKSIPAMAAGATSTGIALEEITIVFIPDAHLDAQREKSLARQYDQVAKRNKQIRELDNRQKQLEKYIESHLQNQKKLL
jgi:hypothetical protein